MSDLRILVVDDHPSVRRSVRALLESHRGWSICGEASNGREAVDQARRLNPDVVLIDLTMPEVDGLQATEEIMKSNREVQVLILTIHEPATLAEHAARAGAKGVLSKSAAPETLIAAIESLSKNR
jgi:DNA-binding NarL/FixJ family response regulator